LKVRVLLVSVLSVGTGWLGAQSPDQPDTIVQNYCAAATGQARAQRPSSMDVRIEASLPGLKKHGKLHALRRISALGRITYKVLGFEGDNTVKHEVIARYLSAEQEAQGDPTLAVTPENYKFQFKGRSELGGRSSFVFQVTPKRKRQGLFKGEIWIDAATFLRVREAGYLVKSPSIFLKRVTFTRDYEIQDGISVPRQVESRVETRLVGSAELKIDFSNYSLDTVAEEPEQ
jgi:hypothetical protein